MVLGKHSGRAAFKNRLEELGIMPSDENAFGDAFVRFKAWQIRSTISLMKT